jgi:hypothetical protein
MGERSYCKEPKLNAKTQQRKDAEHFEGEIEMMDEIGTAVLILGGAALLGLFFYSFFTRSRSFVERWAEKKGYQLLQAEMRLFRRGPFFWSSKGQTVYRVAVLDEQGRERGGWVRCGHWILGMAVEHVEASWDTTEHLGDAI